MKRINLKLISLIIFAIVFIASIIVAIINKGFYYSEFKNQIVVDFADDNSENFEKALNLANISRVDREDLKIYFENTSSSEVTQKLPEASFEISEIIEHDISEIFKNIALFTVASLISFSLIYFYLKFRKQTTKDDLKIFAKDVSMVSISTITSIFFQYGLLAITSRFYQVRRFDIFIPLITLFIVQFLTYRYLLEGSIINTLKTRASADLKNILKITTIILVPLFFGLGRSFVIPAIIIISGIFALSIIFTIFLNINNFKKFISKEGKEVVKQVKIENKQNKTKAKSFKQQKTAKFRKKRK